MKHISLILLTSFLSIAAFAQKEQTRNYHSFFHLDVLDYKYFFCDECDYPKSTHNVTLNLLAGVSENQYGLVIGTIANSIRNNAYGVQIVGFYNYVGNEGKGLAIAGFINNYASHSGVQIAGFNHAKKMRGVQIGFGNNSDDMQGIQIGFINNYEKQQSLKGFQIGGINRGDGGFQIGLCNISETNQYPLGLVNIIKNGEMSVGLAYDEIGDVTTQFRSGSRHLYGIVGFGLNTKSSYTHWALQGGIGAHLNFSSRFRIDMELSANYLSRIFVYSGNDEEEYERRKEEFDFKPLTKYSFGIFPSVRFKEKVEFFAGPTLNYMHTKTLENRPLFTTQHVIWKDFSSSSLKQLFIGYSVGLKYILK